MADKPKKNKNNKRFRHKNFLWDAFSADQKKVLLNLSKGIDKTA